MSTTKDIQNLTITVIIIVAAIYLWMHFKDALSPSPQPTTPGLLDAFKSWLVNGNGPSPDPNNTGGILQDPTVKALQNFGSRQQVDAWASNFGNWFKGLFGGSSAPTTTVQQGYPTDLSNETANYGAGGDTANYLSPAPVDELTALQTYAPDQGPYGVLTPWPMS